ncbi:hypothetical protein P3X46_017046 [Hevea brasiliensis]|uniref:Glycosyltransferase n=1 Tax=Hevea brasiliensis TaxID=3981 RepID=A0ABQ9M4Y0_HEVBR|nr:hypothetical protein P3X46_017046 [Hevea brasiliensis]
MDNKEIAPKTHVLVIPFPGQGHINPLIQFSKRLAFKGLKVTLVIFSDMEVHQTQFSLIKIETISHNSEGDNKTKCLDGSNPKGDNKTKCLDGSFFKNFQDILSTKLPEFIAKQTKDGSLVSCIVEFGVAGASFFTQSCAVTAIYYNVNEGKLKIPVEKPSELPSFVYNTKDYPFVLKIVCNQFSNFREADWIFINTFNMLEEEVMNWMTSIRAIKAIGPTIPSVYVGKQLEDDKEYGCTLLNSNIDCVGWLNSKETGSVVFVSFGSAAALREEQFTELAWGLKRSNRYFLWVVGKTEEIKLPSNFVQETSEKGLVVPWCPQLEVLAHKSVGCFLTHCGWNSTIEALSLGVPMIAMPQWTDQTTNAKFITDVWKVGEEIELCIKEIMVGEKGSEMRNNSDRWKKLANEAVDTGGSSDKSIDEFVEKLVHMSG